MAAPVLPAMHHPLLYPIMLVIWAVTALLLWMGWMVLTWRWWRALSGVALVCGALGRGLIYLAMRTPRSSTLPTLEAPVSTPVKG